METHTATQKETREIQNMSKHHNNDNEQ